MTTSADDVSQLGAPIRRLLTGIGQVQGVTQASRAVGRYFHHKEIRTHLSRRVLNRLDEDLIILGGPAKNQITKNYLEHLDSTYEDRITFDDINCSAGAFGSEFDNFDLEVIDGQPAADIALVVVDRNPFASAPRTVILCTGFTSFGTAAAAEFMFDDLMNRSWRSRHKGGFTWSAGRRRHGFLALLRVRISGTGLGATFTPLLVHHLADA